MGKRARSISTCLLMLGNLTVQLLCQSGNDIASTTGSVAQSSLLDALHAEERSGTYLFYTQSYVDSDNEHVTYHGSVSGFIKDAQLNGCTLTIDYIVADHFSGVVKKHPTPTLEDDEVYSATILLTPNIANSLVLIQGRPTAVANDTNSVCTEKSSCAFTWLQMKSKHSAIRETVTTNGWPRFAGNVNAFVLPVSSTDAGNRLIQQMQSFTEARCSPASTASAHPK